MSSPLGREVHRSMYQGSLSELKESRQLYKRCNGGRSDDWT